MMWCELCGMELGTFRLDGMELSDDGSVEKTGKEKERAQYVKLAFRNGGSSSFHNKLKSAMTDKEWEVRCNVLLEDSFRHLDVESRYVTHIYRIYKCSENHGTYLRKFSNRL